mmetsp:Transcript_30015/g.45520  ORF Transcript_30015/g.45520 Transcript_30015/m.45520 type:complete len:85 (+) Transcript_30015:138-392(+)
MTKVAAHFQGKKSICPLQPSEMSRQRCHHVAHSMKMPIHILIIGNSLKLMVLEAFLRCTTFDNETNRSDKNKFRKKTNNYHSSE